MELTQQALRLLVDKADHGSAAQRLRVNEWAHAEAPRAQREMAEGGLTVSRESRRAISRP